MQFKTHHYEKDQERRKKPGFLRFRFTSPGGKVGYRPIWVWLQVLLWQCPPDPETGDTGHHGLYFALLLFAADINRTSITVRFWPNFHAAQGSQTYRWSWSWIFGWGTFLDDRTKPA